MRTWGGSCHAGGWVSGSWFRSPRSDWLLPKAPEGARRQTKPRPAGATLAARKSGPRGSIERVGTEPTIAADPGWDALARTAAGDSIAFELLVGQNQDRLLRLCERMLGDVDESDAAALLEALATVLAALR